MQEKLKSIIEIPTKNMEVVFFHQDYVIDSFDLNYLMLSWQPFHFLFIRLLIFFSELNM